MTTALERLSKIRTGNDFLNFYKTDTLIGCACDIHEVVMLAKANQQPAIDAMRFELAKAAMCTLIPDSHVYNFNTSESAAKDAVSFADALLAELQKPKQ